ncbi:hypothetical protein [Microvirga lenta]|uniref:hypothetical protein n=1 Tax=Microvirga lenta TaxID=2881337 RepID=UPI001CFFD3BA|nr:hypothetical protein [Microvirga lenta]MCB5174933.1 hypothetical protein [Microvirga lenta]
MLSPLDLKQIKDAVSELRAAEPESVLAALVEEKVRAMEGGSPEPSGFPPMRGRQILG